MGATHKLKLSPTRYPLLCIPLTQLQPSSEPSDSGLPPESTPNRLFWRQIRQIPGNKPRTPICKCQTGHPGSLFTRTQIPYLFVSTPAPCDLHVFPSTSDKWRAVALDIHNWLQDNAADHNTTEWQWALNHLWISYCGSHPDYPATPMDHNCHGILPLYHLQASISSRSWQMWPVVRFWYWSQTGSGILC